MKSICVVVYLCLSTTLFAQSKNSTEDLLFWTPDYRLSGEDFKGQIRHEDTLLLARSSETLTHKLGTIITALDVHVKTEWGKTTYTVRAAMNRSRSWIKNEGDTIVLRHEQGHFDICEIYARMLRRDIRKAKSLAEAKAIYNKTMDLEEIEHLAYDRENTYPLGGTTEAWANKIQDRLQQLDTYKKAAVTVPVYR